MPKKKMRKPFLYVLLLSLLVGGFFHFAYFTRSLIFKEEKIAIKGPSTIKIGIFSDLHAVADQGPGGQFVLKEKYKNFLDEFVVRAKASNPKLVIANGDMIEGTGQSTDLGMTELKRTKTLIDMLPMEKIWIVGNHDLRSLTRVQWKEALGIDYLDKAFESGDYKIIVLDSNYGSEGKMNDSGAMDTGLLLSDAQMLWLENELKNSEKIKIIFMHHPPVTGDDVKPGYAPRGIKKIREIFSKYGVAAVFSGHTERLAHKTVDGVDYYVFPGPTKFDFYPGAYQSIRMLDKKAIVTLFAKNEKGEYAGRKAE